MVIWIYTPFSFLSSYHIPRGGSKGWLGGVGPCPLPTKISPFRLSLRPLPTIHTYIHIYIYIASSFSLFFFFFALIYLFIIYYCVSLYVKLYKKNRKKIFPILSMLFKIDKLKKIKINKEAKVLIEEKQIKK